MDSGEWDRDGRGGRSGPRRRSRRSGRRALSPKLVITLVAATAAVAGVAAFTVHVANENKEAQAKTTPLSLDELLSMAREDPFAPDPQIDALKAQAAQRVRKEAIVASRENRRALSPVEIPEQAPGGGGFSPRAFPAGSNPDPGSNKALGKQMNAAMGWAAEWGCLEKLWDKESGWNERAMNRYSGAYGIPQSLPGSKMASAGADWQVNPATQIKWGLGYIKGRYGSPCNAWAHSQAKGWY